jgi:hypothetical protein
MSDTMITICAAVTTIGLTAIGIIVLNALIGKQVQKLVDKIFN